MSVDPRSSADMRIDALQDLVAHLTTGDLSVRGTPSGDGDALDQIMHGVNQLADSLMRQQIAERAAEQRGDELMDVMMSVAALDYTKRALLRDEDSIFEAFAAGLNMLIDELVAAQETQVRQQETIIQGQAAAIRELSIPLIPISDDVLVLPLIGSIDSARAQHILERLLMGIVENHARAIILDITGVLVVDTQVANALIRAAQAVQLLGAQVVLTGIRPEIAQTLVGLGVNLSSIVTRSTLQAGIAHVMKRAAV